MNTIPLFKVYMSEEAAQKAKDVLTSGYIGQGPIVDEFEKKLKEVLNNDFVVTTNSATSAEHLAVHLLKDPMDSWPGIQEGDEALAPALTCTATNWPLLANGLKIKWVDTDPNNLNMDLDDLARKITKKTKVIMVVHWGGYPIDLDRLKSIQKQAKEIHGFAPAIIEDCAHSFGSRYKNKPIGSHGNINTFSFQAIKHLTCGDGGALVVPHERLYHRAKLLRWYGIDRENNSKDFRCLHPNTLVIKKDGKTVPIKDLVQNKDIGPVLCVDNGIYTYKNITGWHTSDLDGRKFVKITTEKLDGWKSSIVTDDHQILTINGYKRVNELNGGELVATSTKKASPKQEKLIIASLIGDGCFTTKTFSNRAVFNEGHSSKQKEYLTWKHKCLESLGAKFKFCKPNVEQKNPYGKYYIYTPSLPYLGDLRRSMYINGVKRVPMKWLKKHFDSFVMAVWYMDDGCTYVSNTRRGLNYYCEIATNGFIEEDVKALVDFLNTKGFACNYKKHKGSTGFRIFFGKDGSEKLLDYISPNVPDCMAYKLGHNVDWCSKFEPNNWLSTEPVIYYDKLVIKEYTGVNYKKVYCIDVEDVHNFASSSIIVHNCEADVREWGYKFHMNDINAQIGLSNLDYVFDDVIKKHRDNANYFNTVLKDVDGITLLENNNDRLSSSWIYTILVDRQSDFMELMKAHGIMCSRVHERNDIHTCVSEYKSILPSLDKVIKRMICIPAGWWVTEEDREYIYNTIKKGW